MCVTSMVGDHYADKWQPHVQPISWPSATPIPPNYVPFDNIFPHKGVYPAVETPVNRSEFEELKKQVEEMIALMKRAKEYDVKNNEPDCEVDDKMKLLRAFAKSVGLEGDFDIIFK